MSVLRTAQKSENGDNIEDVSTIKYLAPRIYSSQYRAVTANDYTGIIPFVYPNVDSDEYIRGARYFIVLTLTSIL